MAQQVKVPPVGESITEVTVANWLKNDGDVVKMDEVDSELESDKATFGTHAPKAGVLRIKKQKVTLCPIGGLVCEIEEGGAASASAPKQNQAAAPLAHQRLKATGVVKKMKGASRWWIQSRKWPSPLGWRKMATWWCWMKWLPVESDKTTLITSQANGIANRGEEKQRCHWWLQNQVMGVSLAAAAPLQQTPPIELAIKITQPAIIHPGWKDFKWGNSTNQVSGSVRWTIIERSGWKQAAQLLKSKAKPVAASAPLSEQP